MIFGWRSVNLRNSSKMLKTILPQIQTMNLRKRDHWHWRISVNLPKISSSKSKSILPQIQSMILHRNDHQHWIKCCEFSINLKLEGPFISIIASLHIEILQALVVLKQKRVYMLLFCVPSPWKGNKFVPWSFQICGWSSQNNHILVSSFVLLFCSLIEYLWSCANCWSTFLPSK